MRNVRAPWLSHHDMRHTGWTRTEDRYVFLSPKGERYTNVSKSRATRMSAAERAAAVVLMRTAPGHYPATLAGTAVRAALADLHVAPFNYVAERVARWADGDPVRFVLDAVHDRRALLNVLVPERFDHR
jgi:hypothetical protein